VEAALGRRRPVGDWASGLVVLFSKMALICSDVQRVFGSVPRAKVSSRVEGQLEQVRVPVREQTGILTIF